MAGRGFTVNYVQNVTDVDDPLLERAAATGVDWQDLAAEQTELFRHDMEHLRIVPPDHYVAVSEAIAPIAAAVKTLLDRGIAYRIESPDAAPDIYFDTARGADAGPWFLGRESNLDRTTMLELSAERGGDPDRPGKRDPLDPLLWRSERPGEPAWDSPVGRGRPGWHIECTVIGLEHLDLADHGQRRRQRPDLPAPRIQRRALLVARPAGSGRPSTRTPAWWRIRARR